MVTVGRGVYVVEVDGGRINAVQHERDGARGVGLEAQASHIIHQADLIHILLGAGRIERHRLRSHWAWLTLPFFRHLHALLELADAREILV